MKTATLFALLAVSACALGQADPVSSHQPTMSVAVTSSVSPSGVVARVNGVALRQQELQNQMQRLFPSYSIHGGQVPKAYEPEIRQRAMNKIVLDELVYQEASRQLLPGIAADVQQLLGKARARFKTRAEYQAYAKQQYGSVAEFERSLRRAVLIARFWDAEVTQKSRVTASEAQAFYLRNKPRFVQPESITFQTISISVPKSATPALREQARKRAEELLAQSKTANSYEEFGKLAEKYSEDDWRVLQGDHKWVHRGRIEAGLDNAVFAVQANETKLLDLPEGFVIVRVNGRRPQTQLTFSQVKDGLRGQLKDARSADLRKRVEKRLRKAAKIEVL